VKPESKAREDIGKGIDESAIKKKRSRQNLRAGRERRPSERNLHHQNDLVIQGNKLPGQEIADGLTNAMSA
jgi:hypothetical protein